MFVAQAWIAASGAIPAFLICHDITKNPVWAYLIAIAYLFCPTVASGVLFDFHFELMSIPFSMLAILGMQRGKQWAIVPTIVALSLYEVNGLVLPLLGIGYALGRGSKRIIGLSVFMASLAYDCLVIGLVMPAFRPMEMPHVWERYEHLGTTPWVALQNVCTHPFTCIKASIDHHDIASARLFIAFGLLPIIGLKHLLPALPLWVILSFSNLEMSSNIRFGYFAPIVPILVLASAHGIGLVRERTTHPIAERTIRVCLVCGVIWSFTYYSISKPMKRHPFQVRANKTEIKRAISMIPASAPISADWHLLPALPMRAGMLPMPQLMLFNGNTVDYIFIDLSEADCKNRGWSDAIRAAVAHDDFALIYFDNDIALLKRGAKWNDAMNDFLLRIEVLNKAGIIP